MFDSPFLLLVALAVIVLAALVMLTPRGKAFARDCGNTLHAGLTGHMQRHGLLLCMTTGTVKTQGTHLYFVDRSGSPALVKLACPTGITGITNGPADQIEDTCLDATEDKTYQRGLGNPGQVSVPFNLIPREASHQLLFDLKESGELVDWIALLSESTTAPTLDSANEIEPPANRTSFMFEAFVSDVSIDVATNEIVRGTLTLQRSGPVTPTWYDPA